MRVILACFALLAKAAILHGQEPSPPKDLERGTITFTPRGDQKNIPETYRLDAHKFDYELSAKRDLPVTGIEVFELRFPSPVKSKHAENNTVHAEYYRPHSAKAGKDAPMPGVIVLDITGGNQQL